MGKYIDPESMTLEQLNDELEKSFAQWENLRSHGGSDPFYPDGVNMNLVRNHIIWWKKHMEAKMQDGQTSMFDVAGAYIIPTPPKVPDNYVAPASEHCHRFDDNPFWPNVVYEI